MALTGWMWWGIAPHRRRGFQRTAGEAGRRGVALGHHQQVGQFQDAGLDRLHLVAQAGREGHQQRIGEFRDIDLGLSRADGFDQHQVETRRVHQGHHLARGGGQPAQAAAGGGGTDEGPVVGGRLADAEAVSEQRASAQRAGRIDRQHGDAAPALQEFPDHDADQRGLAGTRRPGDADHVGAPEAACQPLQEQRGGRRIPLGERKCAGQRRTPAGDQPGRKIIEGRTHASSPVSIDTREEQRIQYPVFQDMGAIAQSILP
jgi:hypothetical protein